MYVGIKTIPFDMKMLCQSFIYLPEAKTLFLPTGEEALAHLWADDDDDQLQ